MFVAEPSVLFHPRSVTGLTRQQRWHFIIACRCVSVSTHQSIYVYLQLGYKVSCNIYEGVLAKMKTWVFFAQLLLIATSL